MVDLLHCFESEVQQNSMTTCSGEGCSHHDSQKAERERERDRERPVTRYPLEHLK
jgi:hypothetical protein